MHRIWRRNVEPQVQEEKSPTDRSTLALPKVLEVFRNFGLCRKRTRQELLLTWTVPMLHNARTNRLNQKVLRTQLQDVWTWRDSCFGREDSDDEFDDLVGEKERAVCKQPPRNELWSYSGDSEWSVEENGELWSELESDDDYDWPYELLTMEEAPRQFDEGNKARLTSGNHASPAPPGTRCKVMPIRETLMWNNEAAERWSVFEVRPGEAIVRRVWVEYDVELNVHMNHSDWLKWNGSAEQGSSARRFWTTERRENDVFQWNMLHHIGSTTGALEKNWGNVGSRNWEMFHPSSRRWLQIQRRASWSGSRMWVARQSELDVCAKDGSRNAVSRNSDLGGWRWTAMRPSDRLVRTALQRVPDPKVFSLLAWGTANQKWKAGECCSKNSRKLVWRTYATTLGWNRCVSHETMYITARQCEKKSTKNMELVEERNYERWAQDCWEGSLRQRKKMELDGSDTDQVMRKAKSTPEGKWFCHQRAACDPQKRPDSRRVCDSGHCEAGAEQKRNVAVPRADSFSWISHRKHWR